MTKRRPEGLKQLSGSDEMWFSLESAETSMRLTTCDIFGPPSGKGKKVKQSDILKYLDERLHK